MKEKSRVLSMLLAAALLTSCGEKPQNESSVQTETTASQTAAETVLTTETAAASQTAAVTSSAAESTSAVQTAASSALTAQTTVTTTVLTGLSTTAGTVTASSAVQTARQTAVQTTAQTAVLPEKPELPPSADFEAVTLTAEQQKLIDDTMQAIKKQDMDALKRVSNVQTYLDTLEFLDQYTLDTEKPKKDHTEEVLYELGKDKLDTYQITYSARRHDLLREYQRNMEDVQEELAIMSKDENEKAGGIVEKLTGITDIITAEFDYTDRSGEQSTGGIPLFYRDGQWKTDVFLCRLSDMPLTREDAQAQKRKKIELLRSSFRSAFSIVKNKISAASALVGRDIVWKADMLENSDRPEGAYKEDPMQNLRRQMHIRCEELPEYAEIRFLLSEEKCMAVAAQRKDGLIWCMPHAADATSFATLDEAFAHAKAESSRKKQ